MNDRKIAYLNGQTDLWMAQASPGERKELEGLWSDRARLARHLALYLQSPHNVTMSLDVEANALLRYRWARDRELKARQMYERRRDRNTTVNNTFTTVNNTSNVSNSAYTPITVIQAPPAAPIGPAQAQPEKANRGRKPQSDSDLLQWIRERTFKNPKQVGVRQLAEIIERQLKATGPKHIRSIKASRIERALKGASINWASIDSDLQATVTSP